MKKILLIALLSLGSLTLQAQELTWHTDVSKASEIALKEKKPMMMFFTGSDWCGWCIRLQKEVFKTPEFEKWAKNNVILVELDYPRRTPQAEEIKAQNQQLQAMFRVQGYPTIWFVNPEKKAETMNLNGLGNTGYVAGGPEKWLAVANSFIKK
jgi:protein disulfide-isomerase